MKPSNRRDQLKATTGVGAHKPSGPDLPSDCSSQGAFPASLPASLRTAGAAPGAALGRPQASPLLRVKDKLPWHLKRKGIIWLFAFLSSNIPAERHTLFALLNTAVLNIVCFTPMYKHLSQGQQVGTR